MKSDIIEIVHQDEDPIFVLTLTEMTASSSGLDRKNTLRLRLLAEEMMGLLRALTNEVKAKYWIEWENRSFQLHLTTETVVSKSKRRKLLEVASSGKNMEAKGFIGTLREIFDRILESDEYDKMPIEYFYGLQQSEQTKESVEKQEVFGENTGLVSWSMKQYLSGVKSAKDETAENEESWGDLEKSIVVRLADEVKIGIRGNMVEMVVYKNF